MPKKGENIYKRKDGRWEGRFANGVKTDGTKKYCSVYGHTYYEVKEKLIYCKSEHICGTDSDVTFVSVSQQWLNHAQLRVKTSSFENYCYLLDKHLIPYFNHIKMKDFSQKTLNQFISDKLRHGRLRGHGGISRKYLRDMVSIIKSIVSFCEEEHQIPDRVKNVSIPRVQLREQRVLTENEQARLTKYLFRHLTLDNIGILLCLYTGIRLGEVCGLLWNDFNEAEHTITIRRSIQRLYDHRHRSTRLLVDTPKTESSKRVIPLPDFLYKVLKKFKKRQDIPILSASAQYREPAKLRKQFIIALNQCRIPKLRFHDLRHTFASNCIRLQFDIKSLSEILGHSNVSMTLNRYVHSSMENKKKYMNLLKI